MIIFLARKWVILQKFEACIEISSTEDIEPLIFDSEKVFRRNGAIVIEKENGTNAIEKENAVINLFFCKFK